MKSLRLKILLSLMASAVVALLLVTVITRMELHRGFFEFIERQEARQLEYLKPELIDLYRRDGGWEQLSRNPRGWRSFTMRPDRPGMRPRQQNPPRRPPPANSQPPGAGGALGLRDRLFVLDSGKNRVAGARIPPAGAAQMEPLLVDGETIGWVGFRPLRQPQTPEAMMFLAGQKRSTLISLVLALLLAGALGFVLARHISRPLVRLNNTVGQLAEGDYSARARVETRDEAGQLAGGVNRLAITLQKNESARRRWMADVAHELRTPIAILKGELEALDDGVRQADAKMLLSLQEEVTLLGGLVDDLQTLALADAGALKLNRQPLDLAGLLRQHSDMVRDRMRERKIEFTAEAPDTLDLNGDTQRLRQVLTNLMENSLRYTSRGGVVSVKLRRSAKAAELVLEDSGPGVTEEQLERLFERFYRADGSRNRAAGGSGLGLSICRNIVEAHGGHISAGHSPLGGLAICVSLPTES
jgi:two-component system sensor histidine kinase BaeS